MSNPPQCRRMFVAALSLVIALSGVLDIWAGSPGTVATNALEKAPTAALLRASKKAGVKYYFIEDESPSVLEQVPQTLKFLEQVKF